MNAKRSGGHSTVYWFEVDGEVVVLLVYVDDILMASKSTVALKKLKSRLIQLFVMTHMRPTALMLGIEIQRGETGIKMCQTGFIQEILSENGMTMCSPTATPMQHNLQFQKAPDTTPPVRHNAYRRVVGQLQYLVSGTRPDLAFSVGYLSRLCHRPSHEHWAEVKIVLRYLGGTVSMGVTYNVEDKRMQLTGYSSADRAAIRRIASQ